MTITALDADGLELHRETYFSVGGGFVVTEAESLQSLLPAQLLGIQLVLLRFKGRTAEALATYDEIIKRFGGATEPHLRNMAAVTEMGGVIFPPVPAFYAKPKSLDDLVAHSVARVLDLFGVHSAKLARWQGMKGTPPERD